MHLSKQYVLANASTILRKYIEFCRHYLHAEMQLRNFDVIFQDNDV